MTALKTGRIPFWVLFILVLVNFLVFVVGAVTVYSFLFGSIQSSFFIILGAVIWGGLLIDGFFAYFELRRRNLREHNRSAK